jgi:hypothetical protein
MPLLQRLQDYLRTQAHQHYSTVAVPPFTLYFHATDKNPTRTIQFLMALLRAS